MADNRTDEQLVLAHLSGDESALNTLLARHQEPLYYYLLKNSWFKGQSLEDTLQIIFLAVIKRLKEGKFYPCGVGSFKAWLYEVARREYLNQDDKQSRQPKTVSGLVLAKQVGVRDNIIGKVAARLGEYDKGSSAMDDALSQLSLEEQQLLKMVSAGKKYRQIRQEPAFANYSIDYLMRKVYIARNKVKRMLKERTKKV